MESPKIDLDVLREKAQAEEKRAELMEKKMIELSKVCQTHLKEVLPILEASANALETISSKDFAELRGFKCPPLGVRLTSEALCIMFSVLPKRVKNKDASGKVVISNDYWQAAKEKLWNDTTLRMMKMYDKDNMGEALVKKMYDKDNMG